MTPKPTTAARRQSCPVALVLLLLAACPSRNGDNPGTTGGSAGTSTTGAAAGTGRPPNGGSSGGQTAEPPPTLPASSFVFLKRFRRDQQTFLGRVYPIYFTHIYALDLTTKAQTLISSLDDDGKKPYGPEKVALSPDHRWVTFASSFRLADEDKRIPGVSTNLVWAVSVDGKQYKRLTPPPPSEEIEPRLQGRLAIEYSSPRWSSDGASVFLQEKYAWQVCPYTAPAVIGTTCILNKLRAVSDQKFASWAIAPLSCTLEAPIAFHPEKNIFLLQRKGCSGAGSGFWEYSTPTATEPPREIRVYPIGTAGLFDPTDGAWLPDGSGFLLVAGQTKKSLVNPEGDERRYRMGIHLVSDDLHIRRLYEPEDDQTDVVSLDISKTGDVVVEVRKTIGTQESSQLFRFDPQTGTVGEQLTVDGDNGAPAL
jgi:hypothetical protein